MTAGAYGSNPLLVDKTGVAFERAWFGGDGKYESVGGGRRVKWNNFRLDQFSRKRSANKIRYYYAPIGDYIEGILLVPDYRGDYSGAASLWSSNNELKLQGKLLDAVKGHQFNLAVNLGQMNQLTSMVDSNLRKIGRAAIALRRGDFATAARQFGAKPKTSRLKSTDISGRWLELQYGWLPALSDTFEAAKAFEALSNGPRSSRVKIRQRQMVPNYMFDIWFGCLFAEVHQSIGKSIIFEFVEEMPFARQLGLLDPLSVAWELLPYSFVVDWFIPIGSYLSNLNQIPHLSGRFLTTYRFVNKGTAIRKAGPVPWGVSDLTFPGPTDDIQEWVIIDRQYTTQLDVPFPKFNLAGSLSGKRVYNAIALASQAILGKRR